MDKKLFTRLKRNGIIAYWVGCQGSEEIVVYLPTADKSLSFMIPEQIARLPYILCINCMEHGESGKGVVVCGTDGSRLRYYRRETKKPPEKERVYFNVPKEVATVTANGSKEPKIVIRVYEIYQEDNIVYLFSSQLWAGRNVASLPKRFSRFHCVVLAALEKKSCEPCRHAHSCLPKPALQSPEST